MKHTYIPLSLLVVVTSGYPWSTPAALAVLWSCSLAALRDSACSASTRLCLPSVLLRCSRSRNCSMSL